MNTKKPITAHDIALADGAAQAQAQAQAATVEIYDDETAKFLVDAGCTLRRDAKGFFPANEMGIDMHGSYHVQWGDDEEVYDDFAQAFREFNSGSYIAMRDRPIRVVYPADAEPAQPVARPKLDIAPFFHALHVVDTMVSGAEETPVSNAILQLNDALRNFARNLRDA